MLTWDEKVFARDSLRKFKSELIPKVHFEPGVENEVHIIYHHAMLESVAIN